jgi:hypothetical protein
MIYSSSRRELTMGSNRAQESEPPHDAGRHPQRHFPRSPFPSDIPLHPLDAPTYDPLCHHLLLDLLPPTSYHIHLHLCPVVRIPPRDVPTRQCRTRQSPDRIEPVTFILETPQWVQGIEGAVPRRPCTHVGCSRPSHGRSGARTGVTGGRSRPQRRRGPQGTRVAHWGGTLAGTIEEGQDQGGQLEIGESGGRDLRDEGGGGRFFDGVELDGTGDVQSVEGVQGQGHCNHLRLVRLSHPTLPISV